VSRDSGIQYDAELVANDLIEGQKYGEFAPEVGRKAVTGKLTFDLEPTTVGEFLYSLMGTWSGSQQGTTTAYAHTFSGTTGTQHPSYTFFVDRGVDIYTYSGCVVKSLEMSGDNKGKTVCTAEILGITEGTATSWTPTIATPAPLMFHDLSVEIADAATTAVGKWNLKVSNEAEPWWLINASQDASDIVCCKKFQIEGSLDMYFASAAQRTAFLAQTGQKLEFIFTGATITGTHSYQAISTIYNMRYTAIPWDGELDGGLQGASCAFKGYYSVGDTKAIDFFVKNATTTY
jgi:hypothetical protein